MGHNNLLSKYIAWQNSWLLIIFIARVINDIFFLEVKYCQTNIGHLYVLPEPFPLFQKTTMIIEIHY